jgi:hypothetical protein
VSFVYGRITSSVFALGVTTVTLQMDAPGVLNNGLTEVRLSLLRADHHALPKVALDLVSLNVDNAINAQTINLTGALNQAPQVTLPSAATVDIGNAASSSILVTGTTTINSFGVAAAGILRVVEFQSPLTLTYNATSLQIPGGASANVQAGDVLVAYSKGAGNWKVIEYTRFTNAPGGGGVGAGQTWQNPSRALNTQYTNTTSNPIQVNCCARAQSNANQVTVIVDGVTILNSYTIDCCGVPQFSYFPLTFIVPAGSTYQVNGNLGFTVWAELR